MLFYCLFQYFKQKEYLTESKQNETFGDVIFGKIMIQETWSAGRGSSRKPRDRGARPSPGRALPSRGPLEAPPTDFFRLYIPSYPKNIKYQDRSGVPPPQASVATKHLSGALPGTLPEGDPSPVSIFIIPAISMMRRE